MIKIETKLTQKDFSYIKHILEWDLKNIDELVMKETPALNLHRQWVQKVLRILENFIEKV